MKTNQNLKILELRNYLLKPNARNRFVKYFADHFVDSQNVLEGFVLGQFTVEGEPNKFFWMRGFEDMRKRLEFLRAFYEKGEVWKRFGADANEMMIDSDDVYLLKLLGDENFNRADFTKGAVAIDFYFAKAGQLDKLTDFVQAHLASFLERKPTLWVSEMSENDFPRLPVIQNDNLLVSIRIFENKADYQMQLKRSDRIRVETNKYLAGENNLILCPASG